jgi:hypothetical protein
MGGAVLASFLASRGWPGLGPVRLPHLVALGTLAGALRFAWRSPALFRLVFTCGIAAAAAYVLTRHKWGAPWSRVEGVVWTVGIAIAGGLAWMIVEMLADRARGAWLPLLLWLTGAGLGLSLFLGAAELALAQFAGAVASAAAVLAILGWARPAWAFPAAAAAPGMVTLICLIAMTAPKSSDPLPLPAASLLLVAAPIGGLVREQLASRGFRPWAATCLGFGLALLVVGFTVGYAARQYVPMEGQ